jgi:hypothetical protein
VALSFDSDAAAFAASRSLRVSRSELADPCWQANVSAAAATHGIARVSTRIVLSSGGALPVKVQGCRQLKCSKKQQF